MSLLRPLARLLPVFLLVVAGVVSAQTSVPVLMLSDIHFDPFHDPGKVAQLRKQPIEQWPVILNGPETVIQDADRALLEGECLSRARDTAWPLLQTTMTAAHDAVQRPLFITVSGDLLTHEFPCRFEHAARDAKPDELSAFAAKTLGFVVAQIRAKYPRVPVYIALGNNDSGCHDYRETPNDLFLKQTAEALRQAAMNSGVTVTPEGGYSVALPAPVAHGRLIVVEDVFASREYQSCAGSTDRAPERAQLDWLKAQLADASAHHEHVWVMGHIPPGVDVYTSFRRYVLQPSGLCNADPQSYLADTALGDTLLPYAQTVRLAIFGHTHMDEIRVLGGKAQAGADAEAIPVKLIPSVTPYAGNHPGFVVASVDSRTATLTDWRTFVSPGAQGSTPPWTEAYRFSSTYHLPDFSGNSALKLADSFTADKTGQAAESTAFRQHFYPGDIGLYGLGLAQIWPAYACAIREYKPSAVHTCICATLPKPSPEKP